MRFSLLKLSESKSEAPNVDLFGAEMEEWQDSTRDEVDSLIADLDPNHFDLPLPNPINPRIIKAIKILKGPGKKYFNVWLKRRGIYKNMITTRLKERGMPEDLLYLAMCESGFNPKAWSSAQASGIWQFVSGTGRRYGLLDNWWVDERRDPLKATDAALDYLSDLYSEFGDWHQAMAAYNCGEGRIRKWRQSDSSLDFWEMNLPKETQYYVPKILAAMIIGHNPERYGFDTTVDPEWRFDTVTVNRSLSLPLVAQALGVSSQSLVDLNPSLRRWSTPPGDTCYLLRLPLGIREKFLEIVPSLKSNTTPYIHVVLRGESLESIARRYQVDLASLQLANKLKSNQVYRGQKIQIPLPLIGRMEDPTFSTRGKAEERGYKAKYVVKSGDNLYDIARKFKTTVAKLRDWNRLPEKGIIRPGLSLKLYGSGTKINSANEEKWERRKGLLSSRTEKFVTEKRSVRTHLVQPGETLYSIARKYGFSETEIRMWNQMSADNIIRSGQKLKLTPEKKKSLNAPVQYYIVKSGENLWDISQKFKSNVEKLKELNQTLPHILKPGMKIRIR